jgi:hypothetical protein
MKEYGIAYGRSREELLNTMSAALVDGWEPVGGLAAYGLEICQALIREARPKKLVDEQGVQIGEMVISDARMPIEIGEFKYQIIKMDGNSAVVRKVPNVEIKVVEAPANEAAPAAAEPTAAAAVAEGAAPAAEEKAADQVA